MIVNAGYRGKVGAASLNFTYTGQYNQRDDGVVELLTSGTLIFLSKAVIDLFLVGGGGAGGCGANSKVARGGGGGGYTFVKKSIEVEANKDYQIVIGAGGVISNENTGLDGGATTAFGYTANPGKGAVAYTGGANGGSGGGGGGYQTSPTPGAGGSDGANGGTGYVGGGTGQGTTTREFGESTGKLYAGGGGGGYYPGDNRSGGAGGAGGGGKGGSRYQAGSDGEPNSGGGGGGSGSTLTDVNKGGAGGSGIACFRVAK